MIILSPYDTYFNVYDALDTRLLRISPSAVIVLEKMYCFFLVMMK